MRWYIWEVYYEEVKNKRMFKGLLPPVTDVTALLRRQTVSIVAHNGVKLNILQCWFRRCNMGTKRGYYRRITKEI